MKCLQCLHFFCGFRVGKAILQQGVGKNFLERMLKARGSMAQNKLGSIVQKDFIVSLSGLCGQVLEEAILHKSRTGNEHALDH